MKYSLTVSIFPVFVLLIKGSECGSRSSKDISEVTNKVQVDYTQQKRGSGDGPEPLTWIWEPHPNQKNKIKFEPVIAFFENDKESGFDGDEREMHHDDQDVYPTNQQGEWTFTQVSNQKKSKGSKKNKTVVVKGYLPYYKHLKKTNWCFKGVKDYNYHKFKKTAECCNKRTQCRSSRHVERGIYQCSCDINFYRCLLKAGTTMSKSIGKLFFDNKHKVVCYRKIVVKPCKKLPCKVQYKKKFISRNFPE